MKTLGIRNQGLSDSLPIPGMGPDPIGDD